MQAIAFDQGAEHLDRHAEVADIGVGGVVAAERNAHTTHDSDALERVFHVQNGSRRSRPQG